MSAESLTLGGTIARAPARLSGLAGLRGTGLVVMMAAVVAWFVARVFVAPLDHDESQYVATAILSGSGTLYRDFVSLQPPVHSWVYAPLGHVPAGGIVQAMRLLTAAMAVESLAILFLGQQAIGVRRTVAGITTLAMAACSSFQFSASVVRNDMLPMMLLAGATILAVRMVDDREPVGGGRAAAGCGLLLALAAATKLSYVPMVIAVGLCLAMLTGRIVERRTIAFAAAAAVGSAPAILAATAAPESFHWGVYTFARTAPFDWYLAVGRGGELQTAVKLMAMVRYMLTSPIAVALMLVAIGWWRRRSPSDGSAAPPRRGPVTMLACMCLAGLIGAAMPTPTHRQYLLPLLPPLFVLLGLTLTRVRGWRAAHVGLAVSAVMGLLPTATAVARLPSEGSPLLNLREQAAAMRWIAQSVGAAGTVATLSPDRVVDSGLPIDPRFAAGPFLFRSGHLVTPAMARRLRATVPATLDRDFQRHPPGAILVGYERQVRHGDIQVDRPLERWAVDHGYTAFALPDRVGRFYVR